jgi:prophage antirepressor-like protein
MFNISKSPKRQEILKKDERSLMIKEFNGSNIQVYGTYEEPLFKAKDIGDLLEMSNIREVIKLFNYKQRCDVSFTDAMGRKQTTTFLTEQGLYKVLMRSRKKIGEQFQDWVYEVIGEIHLKGRNDLRKQLKLKEEMEIEYKQLLKVKEKELLEYKEKTYEEIEKIGHIYIIKTDGGTKVGKTKDAVNKRIKGLQTGNVNDIEILLDFPTSNADLLEKCAHYILDRYRCNSNREFFDCDINYIKTIIEICGNMIDTLKSSYQHISKDELVKKLNSNEIEIKEAFINECETQEQENNDFYNWLEKNIEYNKNALLQTKDVCELYLGTSNIHTKELSKYRKEIEDWIKEKYKDISWQYGVVRIDDKTYKGWRGLRIVK